MLRNQSIAETLAYWSFFLVVIYQYDKQLVDFVSVYLYIALMADAEVDSRQLPKLVVYRVHVPHEQDRPAYTFRPSQVPQPHRVTSL